MSTSYLFTYVLRLIHGGNEGISPFLGGMQCCHTYVKPVAYPLIF